MISFPKNTKQGFSLVELSVVIIVTGIIIASVMSGKSLVEQSRLKKIASDFGIYSRSIQMFQEYYRKLPGDMIDAQTVFGAANCPNDATYVFNTCNGNGDNSIVYTNNSRLEGMRIWQHLGLADMIDAQYTGIDAVGNGNQATPGINIPISPFDGGYYVQTTTVWWASISSMPVILIGKERSNNGNINAILTSRQAFSVDAKMDDGEASTGNVVGIQGQENPNPACTNGSDDYTTTATNVSCRLAFAIPLL